MKAAAAVLGASLLFFIGVLTGAGRRETVPPPAAIPLGVATTPGASSPAVPSPSTAKDPTQPKATSTATTPPSPVTDATAPSPSTAPVSPGTTESTATTGASSTTSSTGSGQVQQVDGQVDCTSARKRDKGRREPCPSSTTSSTGEAPGGGGNR